MKTTIALLVLFALILGGGYLLYAHNQPSSPAYAPSTSTSVTATSATTSTPNVPAAASTIPAKPAKSGATTGTKNGSGSAPAPGTFTSVKVASHNTSQSCWTSINGNVYDLTKWIAQHPGGMAPILSICGKDGTQAFNQQHGRAGDTRPKEILATFKIGTLAS